jgi:cytochrome b pre-mRNA-processing protein 3
MIVAQARSEAFYRDYGVPDTVEGRLDMLMLHLVLLLRSLIKVPAAAGPTGQRLFDRFCQDIDDNFREMGVGDLAVPKGMQRVVGAFYGRSKVYENALASDSAAALELAVARNVFGATEPPLGARRLAAYIREASRKLDNQEPAALMRAELDFPDPEAVTTL